MSTSKASPPAISVEIHDAGLLALGAANGASSVLVPPSPGYALVDGKASLVGRVAARQARLKPRLVAHRFWRDLGTEPLGRPFPAGLRSADLAHAHLSSLWREAVDRATSKAAGREVAERAILAVPGSAGDEQVGLLLGIAQAAEVPAAGLVDLGLAAVYGALETTATAATTTMSFLHLDLHLHRALITEVHLQPGDNGEDAVLERGRVIPVGTTGLVDLRTRWARHIAERFVQTTRFDPLHTAASDQALHDHLSDWLDSLRDAKSLAATLQPGGVGKSYTVELRRNDFARVASPTLNALVEAARPLLSEEKPMRLLLSASLASVPGVTERLTALDGVEITALEPGVAAQGALAARAAILEPGPALTYVQRLPLRDPAADARLES